MAEVYSITPPNKRINTINGGFSLQIFIIAINSKIDADIIQCPILTCPEDPGEDVCFMH